MSRSAKSRGEKSRVGGAAAAPVPPPSPQESVNSDVVPGLLTEKSWREMIEQEEDEEVVAGLVDELIDQVMDKCSQVHLQKQLVPYCVWWVREALMQIIEWRFLVRDEGDGAPIWTEDQKPEPAIIDSWAEGCVPVVYAKHQANTPLLQKLLELKMEESGDSSDPGTSDRSLSQGFELTELDLQNIKPEGNHNKKATLLTSSVGQAQQRPLQTFSPAFRSQKQGIMRPGQVNEDQGSVTQIRPKQHTDLRVQKRRTFELPPKKGEERKIAKEEQLRPKLTNQKTDRGTQI